MCSKGGTILILVDESMATDLLLTGLEEGGYDCATAATGEDALARLSKTNIDLLLLDLGLLGVSGMELLRQVIFSYPKTLVIIVTANDDVQTTVEAMKIGAFDYIVKPFDLEKVKSSINKALQKKHLLINKATPLDMMSEQRGDEICWTPYLDAVARGVEARYEVLTRYAMAVIQETVAIGGSMGIPQDQIEKWTGGRESQLARRLDVINSSLRKLERNPIAQVALGITQLHQYTPMPKGSRLGGDN